MSSRPARLLPAPGEPSLLGTGWRRRLVLGAVFAVAVLAGRQAQVAGAHLAVFWPASAVGVLWIAGSSGRAGRVLDGTVLGLTTLVLRLALDMPPDEAVALSLAAVVQAFAAAWVHRVVEPDGLRLTSLHHLRSLGLSSAAGALASAPVALAAFVLAGAPATLSTVQWSLRTGVSAFVVLAVVLRSAERRPHGPGSATGPVERALLAAASVVAYGATFWFLDGYPVTFLVLPVAVWVALRRTTTAATVHVVLAATLIVVATWRGRAPWNHLPVDLQPLCAEGFIGCLAVVTLVLALYRDESAASAAQAAAAEEAATEQADLLAVVFGSISDAVCVFDARGDSLLRNPAAERLLGGGVRNARSDWGSRITFLRPDGTPFPDEEVPLVRALRGEAVDGVDLLLRSAVHPEGVLLNVSAHPLPRERGAVWSGGVVAAFHDVSEARAASTRVAEAHELLSNVLAAATEHSIIAVDPEGRITVFNEGAERMLGWDAEEVVGRDALIVHDPQEVRAMAGALGLARPQDLFARPVPEGTSTGRFTYVRRDGGTLPVSLTTSPMRGGDGSLLGWIGMATDVSELENSEELFRVALETAPVGIVMVTASGPGTGRMTRVNRALCRFTGRSEEELLGGPFVALDAAGRSFDDLFAAVLSGAQREQRVELALEAPDGGRLDAEVSATLVRPRGREVVLLCLVEDVTDRRAAQAELHHRALHDALTGLANRTLFLDRLGHALTASTREPRGVGVLYLDLDGFKAVNDTAGHQAGDELLVEVARLLSGCVRPGDTVARLGGDEFAVVCPGASWEADLVAIGHRVLDALAAPVPVRGHDAVVGASIGVRWCPGGGVDVEQVVRDADAAMYAAKRAGKGRVVVHGGPGAVLATADG